MDTESRQARSWAVEEFGEADFGHVSRRSRLIGMAALAATRPAGKLSEVFTTSADAEGAYRWVESTSVTVEPMIEAMGCASACRSAEHAFVFVPVDGSSLTLADTLRRKDFGPIGTNTQGARGLKVMTGIAVSPEGIPLGITTFEWWARPAKKKGKKKPNAARPTAEKETQRWLDAISHTAARHAEDAPETRCWFQLDREGDSWPVLKHLADSGHWFTVRSSRNRTVLLPSGEGTSRVRSELEARPVLARFEVEVAPGHRRSQRTASLCVRVATVELELRDNWSDKRHPITVQAVWVHECGTTLAGESPLDWMLFTNHPVATADDARLVVHGYCMRWRIEDFHKTWKSGACNVEQTQLRARNHVIKWATLLAAVAIRIERLKHLARNQSALPASVELTPYEIRALVLWKRNSKKRTEPVPDASPTIGDAVLWIAQMGGYTGKSSGGPPGSITIARGFERLRQRAEGIKDLLSEQKK